jgi:hypothetical protein
MPSAHALASIVQLDEETRVQFERLRRMRNNLVHGIEIPDKTDLRQAAQQLVSMRRRLFGDPPIS